MGLSTNREKSSERDCSCSASSPPERQGPHPCLRLIEIPVCYDAEFGIDLDRVTEHTKLSEREIVDLHSTREYRVACIGFVPGFTFLAGSPKIWRRRAGRYRAKKFLLVRLGSAVRKREFIRCVPRRMELIGRTPLRLFDPTKDLPTLLCPGDRVRFRAITREEFEGRLTETPFESVSFDECGCRPGRISNIGARSGPTAFASLVFRQRRARSVCVARANLLVGNDEGAAGLEITFGGLQLQFEDERIVGWCGGEFDVQIGSQVLPAGHVAHLHTGDELKFGRAQIGCRCWLAISGGIDVPVVLVLCFDRFARQFRWI